MDPLVLQMLIASVIELLAAPIIVAVVSRRLNHFDEKREQARVERAEDKKREYEQREAEHRIVLAIARTMLLDNYERCIDKGFYTVDEREVYSLLFDAYKLDGGNGVIDAVAEHIRALPTEPPEGEGDC